MPTLFVLAVVIVIIVAAAAVIGVIGSMSARSAQPRDTKKEQDLETLVYELRELAYGSRDVEPNLSFQITDRIQKFEREQAQRRQLGR